ncbi:MAG: hypothetical protein ACRDZT_04155 [Acidimicrobiales bacterium]
MSKEPQTAELFGVTYDVSAAHRLRVWIAWVKRPCAVPWGVVEGPAQRV